jgi:hypothetical protein
MEDDMRTLALVLVIAALLALPVRAEVPGETDPAFVAAIGQWLQGDDAGALSAFSGLARGGNIAAQVFLGQIDPITYLHAPITGAMERKARIALLRQDVGLSGRNWLQAAAETLPLAAALRDGRFARDRSAAVAPLLAAGEVRSLVPVLAGEVNQGDADRVIDILLKDPIRPLAGQLAVDALGALQRGYHRPPRPSATRLLDLRDALMFAPDPPDDGDRMLVFFEPGEIDAGPEAIDAAAAILAGVPVLAPVRAVCGRLCPASVARCTTALTFAGQQSGNAAIPTLSPVESLLPSADYQAAPRFAADLLRMAAAAAVARPMILGIDNCIATLVEETK